MEIVTRLLEATGGLTLVMTPITDTKAGFVAAFNEQYTIGLNRDVPKTIVDAKTLHKSDIANLRARATAGEVVVIIASVQDVRYDDGSDGLRDKYRPLIDNLDMIVYDERHKEYNAELTWMRLANLTARYTMHLSATPYNVRDQFDDSEVIARTIAWGLKHRNHTKLPLIEVCAMDTPFSSVDPVFAESYSVEEGFSSRKWFVRGDGVNFDNEKALQKAAVRMYAQLDARNKNPLSITGSCGLWKLPDGLNGDGVAAYIPALATLLNAAVDDVYFIDSFSLEAHAKHSTIGATVEMLLQTHKKVVILTGEKFLTGTDIEALDHVVVFDKMSSISSFEQLMGRMVRVRPGKERVRMYCLQPAGELKLLSAEFAKKQAQYSDLTKEEVLACLPLCYYNGTWNTFSVTDILTFFEQHCVSTLRNRLPAAELDRALFQVIDFLTSLTNTYGAGSSQSFVFTDDNGARNTVSTKKALTTKMKSQFGKWREMIQELAQDLRAAAQMSNSYDLDTLLKDPMLVQHFGDDLRVVAHILRKREGADLRACLERRLDHVREAFAQTPEPTQWLDSVFLNTTSKTKAGLVYTPLSVTRNHLGQIAAQTPKTVLVINANNGAFAFAARERWPHAEIICYELVDYYISWLTKNGFTVVRADKNPKLWGGEKELMGKIFDVAVGNPPYQDMTTKNRAAKLWKQIITLTLDRVVDNGYLAFVTPPSWLSPGQMYNSLMSQDMQYVNLNISQHFPGVGSLFSAWVLKKQPTLGMTMFETNNGSVAVEHRGLSFLPSTIDAASVSITRKMMSRHERFAFEQNNENHPDDAHLSETQDKRHSWEIRHTNAQTLWSSKKPSNYDMPKVMVTRSGYAIPTYSKACGVTHVMYYIKVKNATEGRNLVGVLQSKLYQVIMNDLWKYNGWNKLQILRYLPAVDRSVNWTDELLYEHFSLTKDEIAYVEARAK